MKRDGHAPAWWPEGEPWPPRGGGGGGPWGHRRPRRWRPFGCLILLFGLFAAGAVLMALWALGAMVGLVEAPAVVTLGGIVAFVVVVAGGIMVSLALRRMTQPLDALIEASGRIEAGDYTARVPVSGGGEMRSLSRAFNQMSAELQASDERRRAFLADVTHELRTPLTIIQGQLEAIEDGVYEPDRERLSALLVQARQMSGLIEDLHTISLAEVGALELRPRPTELGALAEDVVASFAPAAELGEVRLEVSPPSTPLVVALDAAVTQRVLGNLIANAIRHTAAGGSVRLEVSRDGTEGRIDVRDTGSGMDPVLAARAFERFEKGPDSRGSGLGLSIARDLVSAQGGRIELTSEPGHGTVVSVRFPLAPAP